jgi:hypothetical protein
MVKAQELINSQKEREKIKYKTFARIFANIEKKIVLASSTNYYYVWYELPEFIIGCPLYNFNECKKNIIKQLEMNDFSVEEFLTDGKQLILISWFPK